MFDSPILGRAPSRPQISIAQTREATERNGIDLRSVGLLYESPSATGYRPGYGFTRLNFNETLARGADGRFQVYLQDPALVSELDAVQTIAHEITHVRAALAGGNVWDHAYGEVVAELAGRNFR